MRTGLAAAILALAACAYAQQLGRPTLFNNGLPFDDYATGLAQVSTTYRAVGAPDKCVDEAMGNNGCDEADVEAREVTYGDCDTPWILCRCKQSNMTMDDIMMKFGYVPPGIRSYVGGLIAIPAPAASAYIAGGFIVFSSDCVIPVFIHESSHATDQGVSSSQDWIQAVADSGCVPDAYANTNYVEDFAQVSVVYTYLSKHGDVKADPSCLDPQLNVFRNNDRLAQAQNVTSCFTDKRPFTLSASSRPALGDPGSASPTKPQDSSTTITGPASRSTGSSSAVETRPVSSTSPPETGVDAPPAPTNGAAHRTGMLWIPCVLFLAYWLFEL